jgi:xylose isomerase
MFGGASFKRDWHKSSDPLDRAKETMEAAFEFFQKLGIDYYCFHDRDIAPEGETFAQSCKNLETMVAYAKNLQKETGVKLLWGTANLFSGAIYSQGAGTNPNAHVMATAAAQVKHALDATKELGGENYVFWGGREGYESLINTIQILNTNKNKWLGSSIWQSTIKRKSDFKDNSSSNQSQPNQ